MGNDDERERDSWSKTFDPSCAVRHVPATEPPLTWDGYVADANVESQLQRLCRASQPNGSVSTLFLDAVKKITRKHCTNEPSKTAHKLVLLHGPPGNGKTHAIRLMASAVAQEGIKVYHVDLASVKSTWYAQTDHQMKPVLKHVGSLKNAIVFLDEIDSFVGEFNRQYRSNAPLFTEVLQWINGLETKADNNLTIVCATNCMKACDPAFLSRCSLKIEIPPPSQNLRKLWWEDRARHLPKDEITQLSYYEVDSFRSLEQVDEAEEQSAESLEVPPCFADYRERLDRLKDSGRISIGSNQCAVAKGMMASMKRDVGLALTDDYSPHSKSHVVTDQLIGTTDQVKSIAASTAAPTVVSMLTGREDKDKGTLAESEPTRNTVRSRSSPVFVSELEAQTITAEADRDKLKLMESRMQKPEKALSAQIMNKSLSLQKMQAELGEANRQIQSLEKDVKEVREWDSLSVTWIIENFESKVTNAKTRICSEEIVVAGYRMKLTVSVCPRKADEAEDASLVGFYFYHVEG